MFSFCVPLAQVGGIAAAPKRAFLGVQDALGAHQRFTGQLVGDAVRGAGRHLPRDGNESAISHSRYWRKPSPSRAIGDLRFDILSSFNIGQTKTRRKISCDGPSISG